MCVYRPEIRGKSSLQCPLKLIAVLVLCIPGVNEMFAALETSTVWNLTQKCLKSCVVGQNLNAKKKHV